MREDGAMIVACHWPQVKLIKVSLIDSHKRIPLARYGIIFMRVVMPHS